MIFLIDIIDSICKYPLDEATQILLPYINSDDLEVAKAAEETLECIKRDAN